jgi:hypothetical protein
MMRKFGSLDNLLTFIEEEKAKKYQAAESEKYQKEAAH